MKLIRLLSCIALLGALFLGGCGGMGLGDPALTQPPTRVSGVASKGIFTSGTVNIYSLVNGRRGELLKQAAINPAFGTYSANLGSYVGPIVAEASGTYLDEATGATLQVPSDAPIRAALPVAQGTVDLPVTALTEIAVQKTGGSYTPQAIQAANEVVSDLFKVDIVNTRPVAAAAGSLNSASADQVTYTLALATISQLAWDSGGQSLATTLSNVANNIDVASNSMSQATANALQGALTNFTGNTNNQTGITDAAATPLANVGKRTLLVTVSIPGSAQVGAVQGTIALPDGVSLNMGSPALAGTAVGAILATNPSPGLLKLGILSSTGFAAGNILTFSCSAPSDRAVPTGSDFVQTQVKVLGTDQGVLSVPLSLAVAAQSSVTGSAGQSYHVTLSVPGGFSLVGGIQGTVLLPAGFTLNPGSTTLTGSAVGSLLETNPTSSSFVFGIASGIGFSPGSFLTFTCTRTAAGGAPSAGGFTVSGVQVIDTHGATLPVQVTLGVD